MHASSLLSLDLELAVSRWRMVVGVLSWSSGFAATPSLVLNRESIA